MPWTSRQQIPEVLDRETSIRGAFWSHIGQQSAHRRACCEKPAQKRLRPLYREVHVRATATSESRKDMMAFLRSKLAAIEQDLRNASETKYLEGLRLASSSEAVAGPLTSPVFEPAPQELPHPPQAEDGEVLEEAAQGRDWSDMEGISPEGSGREILLQAFNWESHRQNWWQQVAKQAQRFADMGFTMVWLPPPTTSVAPQGYMPLDLYNLNSAYGSEEDLRKCVAQLQSVGLKVLADCVLNHRCASAQDAKGVWNRFGGRLDWDSRAIVGDDRNFGGRGGPSSGELFHAAPNIDHSQAFVKADIAEWMHWLRDYIGFDGFRLDYVKGFGGEHVGDYVAATTPAFVVGEFWDSLSYDGSVPHHNQDAHRQRTVNWINSARGGATAFDVTTKGILHAVFEWTEYNRLKDAKGKAPGLIGFWPSRSTTFLENHDTGSTQGHWRFPSRHVEEGLCYILTHPGTPSIFIDHLDQHGTVIANLIALRKRAGVHCRSKVTILAAEKRVYAADIDGVLRMKIGPGKFEVRETGWQLAESGKRWSVWERTPPK